MQRPVPGEIYVTAFLLSLLNLTHIIFAINFKDIAPSFLKPDTSFIGQTRYEYSAIALVTRYSPTINCVLRKITFYQNKILNGILSIVGQQENF